MNAAKVSALLRTGPLDAALSALDALADEAARSPILRQELDLTREEFVTVVVTRLGGVQARPSMGVNSPALSKDAAYVLSVAKESLTVGDVLRRSVLGRFRTARALHEMLSAGSLLENKPAAKPKRPRESLVEEVLIGDLNASQAAILRTLLRVVMKQSAPFRTVESVEALRASCRDRKPRLIIVDIALPGSGLLALLEDLQRATHNSLLVVGSIGDLNHVRPELQLELGTLIRPFDRTALVASLHQLGLTTG